MECIEVTISNKKVEAFQVQAALIKYKTISKVSVVTCDTVRVYFNPDKVSAKMILKYIAGIGNKRPGGRSKNVKSIREIKDFPEKAA